MCRIADRSWFHLHEGEPREYFIKDSVHREISFPPDRFWLYELVNTLEMQRLSGLRQIALSIFNFPSASHTRLIHSLGVYELCGRFMDHFLSTGDLNLRDDWREINVALAYSLLHDIGHGPLSHVFEGVFGGFSHELMGLRIIETEGTKVNLLLRKKAKEDGLEEFYYIRELEKVFRKTTEHRWILDLVSSNVDVDRLDFILRDSHYSGVSYGNTVDISLLIKWSVIRRDGAGNRRFSFLLKSKNQLEQFLSARKKMYADFYCNEVSRAYEMLLRKIFDHFKENPSQFEGLPEYEKLSFLLKPMKRWSMEEFLRLNDARFLDLMEGLFANAEGEIKKYRDLLFGYSSGFDAKSLLAEELRSEGRGPKEIEIDLWDPERGSFVAACI